MGFSRILKVSLLMALIVTIVGCSATPTRRSFKEGWKDSVVSTKVKFKLTKDKLVKKRDIDVDTWRGVVTLTGRVTSIEQKERAEQLAWQVKGVRGVDNFLKLVGTYGETGGAAEEAIAETDLTEVADAETAGAGTKEAAPKQVVTKRAATHPLKSRDSRVKSKVDGPVVYETETETTEKYTAKRTDRGGTTDTEFEEVTLSSEESLAKEAAEELKRLRGE